MFVPDYIIQMIKDPEDHDSEWGRSCHYCSSQRGSYDKPLEHYIDCPWWRACDELHIPIDPAKHVIFEPKIEPCEDCGFYYVFDEDWRGRDTPARCSDQLRDAHDTHVAATRYGMTLEEYRNANPIDLWLMAFQRIQIKRGGIAFITAPTMTDWPAKTTFEGAEFELREGEGGICAPLAPLYDLQQFNTDRRPPLDADTNQDDT